MHINEAFCQIMLHTYLVIKLPYNVIGVHHSGSYLMKLYLEVNTEVPNYIKLTQLKAVPKFLTMVVLISLTQGC